MGKRTRLKILRRNPYEFNSHTQQLFCKLFSLLFFTNKNTDAVVAGIGRRVGFRKRDDGIAIVHHVRCKSLPTAGKWGLNHANDETSDDISRWCGVCKQRDVESPESIPIETVRCWCPDEGARAAKAVVAEQVDACYGNRGRTCTTQTASHRHVHARCKSLPTVAGLRAKIPHPVRPSL